MLSVAQHTSWAVCWCLESFLLTSSAQSIPSSWETWPLTSMMACCTSSLSRCIHPAEEEKWFWTRQEYPSKSSLTHYFIFCQVFVHFWNAEKALSNLETASCRILRWVWAFALLRLMRLLCFVSDRVGQTMLWVIGKKRCPKVEFLDVIEIFSEQKRKLFS